ncbi:MAG: hypothetical protein JWO91_143 [Acidobacteriaceae bacterium]|nr:hypothetical protein [Acidobacteriaceae bacterium]
MGRESQRIYLFLLTNAVHPTAEILSFTSDGDFDFLYFKSEIEIRNSIKKPPAKAGGQLRAQEFA